MSTSSSTPFNVLIVGVFGTDGKLSRSAQRMIASKFQSNKFLQGNSWVGQTRSVDVSLFNSVDDVFEQGFALRDSIQRVVFVGLAKKEQKPEENPVAMGVITQYSAQAVGDAEFVQVGKSVRAEITKIVESLKKEKKDENVVFYFDDFQDHAQAVAEGAALGAWKFDLNYEKFLQPIFGKDGFLLNSIKLVPGLGEQNEKDFKTGTVTGAYQLFSRYLIELPANYLTPIKYTELIKLKVEKFTLFASPEAVSSKFKINVYDEDWAKQKGMGSFLSVTAGTEAPARVLELIYVNDKSKKEDEFEIALLGKGITFDSGGISLKPGEGMKEMKGDMGGSSCAICSTLAALELDLPLNIITVAMLCENMPSGIATKPGDVVTAMNGKTIEVDNTDAEGRLILADGLCYLSDKKPQTLIDMATLTGAVIIALSHVTAAVFSNSTPLVEELEKASFQTSDYLWRLPIFREDYLEQMKSDVSDYNNIGGRPGGSCTAATFLSEFVDFSKVKQWAHLDIAAVTKTKVGYTGRPTRAVIEFLQQRARK
ncbi:hypothetical protein C9374_012817 [Naegleria lovaniensis]|uniref:Cytosol aminopeptidase domain-containing protein n=2 Tax=Naegleria lovaniensis TaxID=51637 RepID=A0AA88KBH4_NAELO|nr:uncharacterized protein C9374_012817 [Naegleria lovaniensis]KAG2373085.1 hypothetical protein C9374_012817 [Naegleria lovaniensis]